MIEKVIVGIDTSNYTTSCAVCSLDGEILENYKESLPVKVGENGLRQSEAVFSHVKNFQLISKKIKEKHADYEIVAIGYSSYPRDVAGSYMPCFLVGNAVAEMISALYNIPSFAFSHQAGHIQAALYSSKLEANEKFVAFHVSGGTTEILLVTPNEKNFSITIASICAIMSPSLGFDGFPATLQPIIKSGAKSLRITSTGKLLYMPPS